MRGVHDATRTAFLEEQGYRVLRFRDNDALVNADGVLERIAQALTTGPSPRPSPQRGEGEGRGTLAPEGRVRGSR